MNSRYYNYTINFNGQKVRKYILPFFFFLGSTAARPVKTHVDRNFVEINIFLLVRHLPFNNDNVFNNAPLDRLNMAPTTRRIITRI